MTRGTFFFKNHSENETGRLVPDLCLFFKKALCEVKASGLQLSFNISGLKITVGAGKSWPRLQITDCLQNEIAGNYWFEIEKKKLWRTSVHKCYIL